MVTFMMERCTSEIEKSWLDDLFICGKFQRASIFRFGDQRTKIERFAELSEYLVYL